MENDKPLFEVRDEAVTNAYFHYEDGRPVIVITTRLGYLINAVSWRAAEEKLLQDKELPIGALTSADVAEFQADPYHTIVPRPGATMQVRDVAYRYAHALSTYVLAHEYGHFALGHMSAMAAQVGGDNDVTQRARLSISRLQELEADSAAVSIVNTELGNDVAVQGLILNTSLLLATEHVLGPSDPYTSDHPYWKDRLQAMLDVIGPPSASSQQSPTSPNDEESPAVREEVRIDVMGVVGKTIMLKVDAQDDSLTLNGGRGIGPYWVAAIENDAHDYPVVVFSTGDKKVRCRVGESVVLRW